MKTKLHLFIIVILTLVAVLPQAASAQLVIDRITVKDKINDQGRIIGVQMNFYTSAPATTRIDYGLTKDYGFFNGSSVYKTYHEIILVGLKSSATYNYRITAVTASGEAAATLNYTFRTGKISQTTNGNLSITNVRLTHVGGDYFIATWQTPLELKGEIRYNTVEDFKRPSKARATRYGNEYESVVTRLKLNTKYYWQVYVYDNDGNYGTSSVQTLTTASIDNSRKEPLVIRDVSPANQADTHISDTAAVISWYTNIPAKANVSVRSAVRGGGGGTVKATVYTTENKAVFTNLKPNTDYTFTIAARDVHGKRLTTGNFGFTTKTNTPAPQVAGASTECYRADWTYQQCRNFNEEKARAEELKTYLNQVYRNNVPPAALRNWYTLVNAYTYGGYSKESIVKAVKWGGKTVHPTIPYSAWQTSQDFKNYITI